MATLSLYPHASTPLISEFDLLTANAVRVKRQGHTTHQIGPGLWEERYRILGVGTPAQIRTATNEIVAHKAEVERYHTLINHGNPVWLREQSDGESSHIRHALIYDISIKWLNRDGHSRLLRRNKQAAGELVIQRGQWERNTSATYNNLNQGQLAQVLLTNAGGVEGNMGARIAKITFGDVGEDVKTIWMGFRAEGYGSNNFTPLVEAEDAGTLGDDTSVQTDAGSSNGERLQITYSTEEDYVERATFSISDFVAAAAEYPDYAGEYLVLMAYQQTSSLAQHMVGLTGLCAKDSEPVYVPSTGTSHNVIEIGYLQFPGQSIREAEDDYDLGEMSFSLNAERVEGSSTLYIDYLVLIPANHMLKITDANLTSANPNQEVVFITHPNGEQIAFRTVAANNDDIEEFLDFDAQSFEVPAGSHVTVIACEQNAVLDDTADIDVIITTVDRYDQFGIS